jgi:MFS family permease
VNLKRALFGPARGRPSERAVDVEGTAEALAERLLAASRVELTRADTKASTLFAASGVVFGVILGAIFAGDWSPLELHDVWQALWWLGAAAALAGLVALGLAIFPRIRHPEEHERVRYFGDVARKESQQHLAEALKNTAEERGHEHVVDQLWVVSQLALSKYELIRWALYLFGLAAAVLMVSFFGDHRFR